MEGGEWSQQRNNRKNIADRLGMRRKNDRVMRNLQIQSISEIFRLQNFRIIYTKKGNFLMISVPCKICEAMHTMSQYFIFLAEMNKMGKVVILSKISRNNEI